MKIHQRGISTPSIILLVVVVVTIGISATLYYIGSRSLTESGMKLPVSGENADSQPEPSVTIESAIPVVIYTDQVDSIQDDKLSRSFPVVDVYQKVGDGKPELLVSNMGKVGEYVHGFTVLPDKKRVLINLESKLQILYLDTKQLSDFFMPKKQVQSFIIAPDNKHLLIWDQIYASEDHEAYLHRLDLETWKYETLYHGDTGGKYYFIAGERPDGNIILMAAMGEASDPYYFDIKSKTIKHAPGLKPTLGGDFSHDSQYVAYSDASVEDICNDFMGSAATGFAVYDTVTGQNVGQFGIDGNVTQPINFSPDGKEVLYASYPTLKEIPGEDFDAKMERCNNYKPVKTYYMAVIAKNSATPVSDYKSVLTQWYPDELERVLFDTTYKYVADTNRVVILFKDAVIFEASSPRIDVVALLFR